MKVDVGWPCSGEESEGEKSPVFFHRWEASDRLGWKEDGIWNVPNAKMDEGQWRTKVVLAMPKMECWPGRIFCGRGADPLKKDPGTTIVVI